MDYRLFWRTGTFLLITCSLAACSNNTPRENFMQKAQQSQDAVLQAKAHQWQSLNGVASTSYLTDLIQDPSLDELIQQALRANPNLQKTMLTLKASLWQLQGVQANRLPSVDAGFSSTKTKDTTTSYSANASVSWELDLWQKLANTEQASAKTLASDEATFQASRDTLVANVMKTWLAIISRQHLIDIEQQRLTLLESNEKLIIQRFKNGLDNLEKLDEARTATSQSKANLAEYKENLAIKKRDLQLLIGSVSPFQVSKRTSYPTVSLTLDNLPEQSLQRRPDLKAAYLAIEAADLNTTVAYKNMLPSINLSATLRNSDNTARLALFTNPVWTLLAQLTQPLYDGGKLKAAAEIAKLQTAQAYQAYREKLLTAVNEVENTLGQEQVLQQRVQHIRDALTSSQRNLAQYEKKYRSGIVELNDLITVQKTTFNLEAQLDELIFSHLSNRIDLGLALGLGVKQE